MVHYPVELCKKRKLEADNTDVLTLVEVTKKPQGPSVLRNLCAEAPKVGIQGRSFN